MQIGAQLYTLREHTKTLPDIEATLKKVRAMGYPGVQISGFGPVDPAEVAKIVRDLGLEVAATHMGWKMFLDDLDRVIEIHQLWDCKHSAIGGLPSEYHSLDGLRKFADELGPVAEKLAAAGMDFSYHNHNHELVKLEGKTWLERLYETIPGDLLKAELDVYWIVAGGGDPAWWIRHLGKRQPVIHFKDMMVTPDRIQQFAPVGEGNLNWPAIFDACREADVEWGLVEQDKCYDDDPFDCLERSLRFLEKSV